MREVKEIYKPSSTHWVGDGFLVTQIFSHMGKDKDTNPFLMLDYAKPREFKPNYDKPRGVASHPHKGFEIATIAYQGEVSHRDSSGGRGTIKAGDVQWINIGSGVLHDEFHSKEFSQRGGVFEMVQLWINLPAKFKLSNPSYQHIKQEQIPKIKLKNSTIELIAGEFKGYKAPAKSYNDINVWTILLDKGDELDIDVPTHHSLSIAILIGDVLINGTNEAKSTQLASFYMNGKGVKLVAPNGDAKVLFLSGAVIDEPIAAYGPFVMNTKQELNEAIYQFNASKFGSMKNFED